MPTLLTNGVELEYDVRGEGDPVLLLAGAGNRRSLWEPQVRVLVSSGYQVVTYDQRGASVPAGGPPACEFGDLVADAIGVIDALHLAPCRIAGFSLGAKVAQELAAIRPEWVRAVALLGTTAGVDAFRAELLAAHSEYLNSGAELPSRYRAVLTALQMFSPRTLADDEVISDWLELLTFSASEAAGAPGAAGQYAAAAVPDQRDKLATITSPCLVVSFTDDLVTPAFAGAEVARLIPGSEHVELPDCGHLGLLERPDDINRILIDFFGRN